MSGWKRLLALSLAAVIVLLSGCAGTEADKTATPAATSAAPVESEIDIVEPTGDEDGSWAIYWYLCGSDLETDNGFATNDLAEMMEVQLPDNVTVVIQAGGAREWKNSVLDADAMTRMSYTSAGLETLETLPPSSMGSPDTLVDFLGFCEENFPADHTALLFWNHGSGSGICFDQLFEDDSISLAELSAAFEESYGAPGEAMPFDLIGFDTCLMATVDTAAICAGYAGTMVASAETEPGCGWLYSGWLGALADDPGLSAQQLGTAICDSYYEGCAAFSVEGKATLSTLDLSAIGGVVEALDALSLEAISAAMQNGPSSFFADYGRGAWRAVSYGGEGAETVDLVGLVTENRHLFPGTADDLLSSIDNCVVYQVTGPYRSSSSGLAAFFPYYVGDYTPYFDSFASPAMGYLYSWLLSGEISDEALDYLNADDAFDDELIGGEYGFDDAAAYNLEDSPIDIVDDGDFTYAQMDIGPAAAELLQRVTFMLASYTNNGEIVMLGEEADLSCNWEEGVFTDSFIGRWGAIDGHPVTMTVDTITDSYILYSVPILINGREYSLAVSWLFDEERYEILAATPETDGDAAPKQQDLLMPEDEITTLFYYLGDDDEGLYEAETFTFTEDSSFSQIDLPDGDYAFMYLMYDYKGESYSSEVVPVVIEDGMPIMGG